MEEIRRYAIASVGGGGKDGIQRRKISTLNPWRATVVVVVEAKPISKKSCR